jgi:hypothetical protein
MSVGYYVNPLKFEVHIGVICKLSSYLKENTIRLHHKDKEVEVEVNLRPTVSRPVCPGVRRLLGPVANFSFAMKFPVDNCGFVILYRPL